MAYHNIPAITEKRESFIQGLVDQLGYKDSLLRDYFVNKLNLSTATIGYASNLIEMLLNENKVRKFPQSKNQSRIFPTVQDLAQFSFCPASYSIKETFEIEENERSLEEQGDFDKENCSRLLDFLSRLTEMNDQEKKHYSLVQKEIIDLADCNLVYNGCSSDEGLFDVAYNIFGKLHLIFKTYSGDNILILEKDTLSIPAVVQANDLIQAIAYINLFPRVSIAKVYIIYWDKNNQDPVISRNHKLFIIENSEINKRELFLWLGLFDKLNLEKYVLFDINKLDPEKCYECSCRAICNHKSGFVNDLTFPYTTKDYYQKYPLNYGMDEHQELAQIGILEAEKYAAIDGWSMLENDYKSESIKREHFLLQELIYPFEKKKVGQVSDVELSDVKMSKFGDKYIEVDKSRVYIINIQPEYMIYSLTYKLANGTVNFILFGE